MADRPLVFFGTPDFAVPTLEALCRAGRPPALVVTQPSRPAGRGQRSQDSAVARWAAAHGLPVEQPERVREPAFLERLAALAPEVAVVVAFGQIFPRALLALPTQGCINLHASLLPRYRGAAPIQAAIAAGEAVTGNTTMQMEAGLDSGPILLQEELPIGPRETAGELGARLAAAGGRLMVETLERLERGELVARPQPHELATYAPRLTRDSGRADWASTARELFDRLRAYTPWPGLTAGLRGAPVKLVWGEVVSEPGEPGSAVSAAPGEFLGLRDGRAAVACGGGTVFGLETLQRPGRKPVPAAAFVNGERLAPGELFTGPGTPEPAEPAGQSESAEPSEPQV
jgi:methionyl-tRNA formyltransferase